MLQEDLAAEAAPVNVACRDGDIFIESGRLTARIGMEPFSLEVADSRGRVAFVIQGRARSWFSGRTCSIPGTPSGIR